MRFGYLILLLCWINLLNSQSEVSELFNQLSKAKHDTARCNLLIQIAENLYYSKPDTVKPLCEEVIRIVDSKLKNATPAGKRSYLISKGSALTDIGVLEGRAGNYDKEIFYNLESIEIQKEVDNKIGLASSYNNLGIVYSNIGDVSKAIEYCFKALKLQEEIGDKEGQALSLNNIGYNFKNIGENKKALEYYNKSLALHREIKSVQGEAMTLNNIANIYEKIGLQPCSLSKEDCIRKGQIKALELYEQCYKLQKESDDKLGMAYALNNIAISYKNLGDPKMDSEEERKIHGRKMALSYFLQSLELHKTLNNKRGIAYVADNIANLYFLENNLNKALEFSQLSFNLAQELGEPGIVQRAAGTLKNIYRSQKKFSDAFAMFEIETQMKDSVNNEGARKLLFQKSIQYNFEKKALADSLRNAEEIRTADLKLQKEIATKNTLLITSAGIVLVTIILSVLLFVLARNIRERKKAYAALEHKNTEIKVQSEKLLALSKEITKYQTQMNPHFVFNALNSIQGFVLSNQKENTLKQLQNFAQLMRQTLNNSNNETIDLKTELEFLKLYVDFESVRFSKAIALKINADSDLDNILIPPMLIQPLIENSLKHAGLNKVATPVIELLLEESNALLNIEVKDNGKGIKKNSEDIFSNSHALGILRSRLQLVFQHEEREMPENNITLHSNDDYIEKGTSIKFSIPLVAKF